MFTVANRDSSSSNQRGKESIHSGHFMVSQFEAEEQDDEYELAVPIPEPEVNELPDVSQSISGGSRNVVPKLNSSSQPLTIDTSLSKLFQCMTIAYRQKLTSPKWNRFRGIRLRWKDKIRLNNVIWRCWHMQFIKKKNTYICQFASPLDVDTHNKPEAIVLEGKYWKRKLAAVTAEYKKWRMFFRNHSSGHAKDMLDPLYDLDCLTWNSPSSDNMHMMVDEDYLGMMSDTLFSTISSQNFVFPDSREIAKAGLADFIQPSLGPLQPNLDDYMDTFEPLQELLSIKLPTVPEENGPDTTYKQGQPNWCYTDLDLLNTNLQINAMPNNSTEINQFNPIVTPPVVGKPPVPIRDAQSQISNFTSDMPMIHPVQIYLPTQPPQPQPQPSSIYQLPPISKSSKSISKRNQSQMAVASSSSAISFCKQETAYPNYNLPEIAPVDNSVRLPMRQQTFNAVPSASNVTQPQQISSQGYKFTTPSLTPSNLKFTSQNTNVTYKTSSRNQHISSMEVKTAMETPIKSERSRHRINRQRSISMSREPIKKPPLLSAISDPSLLTPSNSVLLTQLLTNSTQNNILTQTSNMGIKSESLNLIRVKEEVTPMSIVSQTQIASPSVTMSSSLNDQMLMTTLGASNSSSPSSSQGIGSCPTSPQTLIGSPSADRDYRRVGHIHAEQKRRYNIKNGFDMIHSLIPQLNQNPNAKLSKAAMLQKGAEYIRQLQQERSQLKEEMDNLRQQIDALNTSINNCQSLLSATGAPVSMKKDNEIQEMFDEYIKKRTMEDWKFWIFSLLFKPLLISFNNFVSTSSLEDLYRSTLHWVEQHCTLVDLRPSVLNSLKQLCTKTDVLAEPEKLPEQIMQAVASQSSSGNSS